MIFYPSKCNNRLNKQPFFPELVRGRALVNPNYPVDLAPGSLAVCDSGAFQDIDAAKRLTPGAALNRQLAYELRQQTAMEDYDWHFEAVVTYDQMLGVDEQVIDGKKVKKRGNEETARPAIEETLNAAKYYHSKRSRIQGAVCFAAQGASPIQYVEECVLPLLEIMQPEDWFAFGGFCIIGKVPSLKKEFAETLRRVLPLLKRKGIKRAHILGVTVTDMVQLATYEAAKVGIEISTDSSSLEVNATFGRVFADGKFTKTFDKADKMVNYHPCDLAISNIEQYYEWLDKVQVSTQRRLDEERQNPGAGVFSFDYGSQSRHRNFRHPVRPAV